MRMRSGWWRGSIYWVLLFWGQFSVSKPLSQKHGSTFLPLQDADPTPSFGGFGVKQDWDFPEPRNLLVGSPENVVEKIQELQEVCHLEYLLVEFTHMGIPLQNTLENLETFATKAMSRFAGNS